MNFYHGTSEEAWEKIQEEGVLWGIGNSYRYTYLAPEITTAHAINPEVILEVQYEPDKDYENSDESIDNYGFDPPENQWCWQFSVFVPIDISRVKRLNQQKIDKLMKLHKKNRTQKRFQLNRR